MAEAVGGKGGGNPVMGQGGGNETDKLPEALSKGESYILEKLGSI
jgi:alanyl-tRNA synthetase